MEPDTQLVADYVERDAGEPVELRVYDRSPDPEWRYSVDGVQVRVCCETDRSNWCVTIDATLLENAPRTLGLGIALLRANDGADFGRFSADPPYARSPLRSRVRFSCKLQGNGLQYLEFHNAATWVAVAVRKWQSRLIEEFGEDQF